MSYILVITKMTCGMVTGSLFITMRSIIKVIGLIMLRLFSRSSPIHQRRLFRMKKKDWFRECQIILARISWKNWTIKNSKKSLSRCEAKFPLQKNQKYRDFRVRIYYRDSASQKNDVDVCSSIENIDFC